MSIQKAAPAEPASQPAANQYTADALERVNRVRAIVADLPGGSNLRPLRRGELALATSTSAESLDQAAVIATTAPEVGGSHAKAEEFRDAIDYVFAYQQLREEMAAALRQIDLSLAHRKLRAIKLARLLYHVAKAWAASEVGDALKPFVKKMQRTLVGGRRKKAAPATPSDPEAKDKK